jgi:hypothetical protein
MAAAMEDWHGSPLAEWPGEAQGRAARSFHPCLLGLSEDESDLGASRCWCFTSFFLPGLLLVHRENWGLKKLQVVDAANALRKKCCRPMFIFLRKHQTIFQSGGPLLIQTNSV